MMSLASPTSVMAKTPIESPTPIRANKSKLHNDPQTKDLQNNQRHHASDFSNSSSVQVAVRIRPMNQKEIEDSCHTCVEVYPETSQTTILKSMSSESTGTESTVNAWSSNESQLSSEFNNNHISNNSSHTSRYSGISPTNSMTSYQTLQIASDKGKHRNQTYTFDHVFPSSTPQIDLYERCVTPLVQSCIEGYNATVLAYGQTGSGKTHTILGSSTGEIDDVEGTRSNEGVIPRALKQIFNGLESLQYDIIRNETLRDEDASFGDDIGMSSRVKQILQSSNSDNPIPFEYQVKIQFLEVYGEEIRDLLTAPDAKGSSDDFNRSRSYLLNRQSSVTSMTTVASIRTSQTRSTISIRDGKSGEDAEVLGANKFQVTNAEEALQHLHNGLTKRVVGKTAMNSNSSRSHAIFTVTIHQTRRKKSGLGEKLDVQMKTSKIHIVDLSGSERVKRSMTMGRSMKEGIDINKGLSVLGKVISALSSTKRGSKAHIPYRDSKLTRLLKGSLGGNHKTLMIACISPSNSNTLESNNTLRYANRAKNIKNKAKINIDPSSRVVNELKGQVIALAAELLKERRKRANTDDFDEDIDDCPFSIDFLDELVSGADSKSLWMKQKASRKSPVEPQRPQTEPSMPHKSIDESIVVDSWEASEPDIKTMYEVPPSRESSTVESDILEDPNLDRDIVSYDFALRKLKESFEEKSDPRLAQQKEVRVTTPSLGKVRDIDELYDYLNQKSNSERENDNTQEVEHYYKSNRPGREHAFNHQAETMPELKDYIKKEQDSGRKISGTQDSEGYHKVDRAGKESVLNYQDRTEQNDKVVSNVVKGHIAKLDETLAHNETLLMEMTKCHRRYEMLMTEYMRDLQNIQMEVNLHDKDKKKFENVIDLIEEGSQYSDSMVECLKDHELRLEELEKKRGELKVLTQVANQNDEEIQNLLKSIEVVRQQRDRMRYILNKEVLPPMSSRDDRTTLLNKVHYMNDSTDQDPINDLKDTMKEENKQLLELRQEIELLKQRLYQKDMTTIAQSEYKEEVHHIDALPKSLRNKKEQPQNNVAHSINRVPTTLNLQSNSAEFSALDGIPTKRPSVENVKMKMDFDQKLEYNPNSSDNSSSSLSFKRQGRRKYGFMTQINTNSDQIFLNEDRNLVSDTNRNSLREEDHDYDLNNYQKPKKRIQKKTRKTSSSKYDEKQIDCEEICPVATYIVQLIRNVFGTKKDPVVRQW